MSDQNSRDDANRESISNRAKGFGKELEGKGRNALGGLTDDTSEQFEGKAKELEGKAQQKLGESQKPRSSNDNR